MGYISTYIYSNCTTLSVGCILYSDYQKVTPLAYKQLTLDIDGIKKIYITNAFGAIASISASCFWESTQYVSEFTSGVKNDCVAGSCSVVGEAVSLNDGNPNHTYTTSGYAISYVSQQDANSKAYTIAYNAFQAGKQAKINELGICTWTYSTGSATYPATSYTRNNCASNCDAGSITYQAVSKSNYAAQSNVSCTDAVNTANAAAYSAAQADSQALGQAYANANATCCCWVAAPDCSGCDYRGNRQRNECYGTYRYETPTAYGTCDCGQGCHGTYYGNWYCSGADNKNKTYYETYNCNGANTGASYTVNCGCNDGATDRQDTGLTTCIGCTNVPIYKDVNRCSSTYNHYFVNGIDQGTSQPNSNTCWTGTDYSAYKGVYCYSGTNYDVYEDTNHTCSQQTLYQLRDAAGDVQGYNDNLGASPCQFSAYRSGTFTRNNCPSGYTAGSVSYSNTYYYTGVLNQAGADYVAASNFNTDGQNYANANGSCTAPVTCYIYNIISNNSNVWVTGNYTTCGGNAGSINFYSSSAYSQVGTICAQSGSISGMTNGQASNTSTTC